MAISRTAARGAAMLTATALAILLSGCLKVDTDLTIEGGRVSGTLLAALAADDVAPLGITPEEIFADQDAGLAGVAGVTSEPYAQGRWAGTRYTLDQVDIDELNAVSEGDPDGLRIVRDEQAGTYEFLLVIDLRFVDDLEQSDLDGPGAPNLDLAQLRDGFEVSVAVTFPDRVLAHNGERSGTTVSWQPPAGERSELRALGAGAGDPAASGDPTGDQPANPDPAARTRDRAGGWRLAAAAALLLLAAGAAGTWIIGRRRRNRDAGADVG